MLKNKSRQPFQRFSGQNTINNDKRFTKPLPPYGKEAGFLLSWGVQPRNDFFIFVGINAWKKAKAFKDAQVVLCLPFGEDPFKYFWPVCDWSVLMLDTGGLHITDIEEIAYCLLCANATIVRVVLINNALVVYRRDVA